MEKNTVLSTDASLEEGGLCPRELAVSGSMSGPTVRISGLTRLKYGR